MRHAQGRAGECQSWLGPPSRIKSENCSERFTGRPRPIPDDGSTRSMTRSHRRDVLERAWELVRANKGAAGIDRQTIADVEQYGVSRLLDELAAELRERALASASRAPGVHPEARARGASSALDSRCSRPRCSSGHEDRHRASLRGGLSAVLVRVSAQAITARRAPGADRSVLEGQAVGFGVGCRQLFRGDSALGVDVGDRGAGLGPPPAEAAARDVARRSDAGWCGPPRRGWYSAGRCCLARPVQRLSAPARPAVDRARDWGAGAFRG